MNLNSTAAVSQEEEHQYYVMVDPTSPTPLFRVMGTEAPGVHLAYAPQEEVDNDPLLLARKCLGDRLNVMRKGHELEFQLFNEEEEGINQDPPSAGAWLEGSPEALEALTTDEITNLLWALAHTLSMDDAQLHVEDVLEDYDTADHPELIVEKLSRFNKIDEMLHNHRAGALTPEHYALVNSKRWAFDHDDACTAWFDFRGQMGVQTIRFSLGNEPGSLYTALLLDDMSNDEEESLYADHATQVKALRRQLIAAYVAITGVARPEFADFLKARLAESAESKAGSMDGTTGFSELPPVVHRTPIDDSGNPVLH